MQDKKSFNKSGENLILLQTPVVSVYTSSYSDAG